MKPNQPAEPPDLLEITPPEFDFGCGAGPSRPEWKAYVRESDLRRALERGVELGRPVLRVPKYTRDGRKVSEVAQSLPPGLREAYEKKNGYGMAVHRCYMGTGAIIRRVA